MSVQCGGTQAQGTGRGEGCGRGEEEQSQQLEKARGQQHVATVDQHRHGQHHIGQQPAEKCHPGEPAPGEGLVKASFGANFYLEGLRWRLGDPRIPQRGEVGIPACGLPNQVLWSPAPDCLTRDLHMSRGEMGGSPITESRPAGPLATLTTA